jgi:hypothetical protein
MLKLSTYLIVNRKSFVTANWVFIKNIDILHNFYYCGKIQLKVLVPKYLAILVYIFTYHIWF